MDIETSNLGGAISEPWFVDFETDNGDGITAQYGQSCSQFKDIDGHSASAVSRSLRIGSTAEVRGFGRPGATPMLLLGVTPYFSGIDLGFIGAPGCKKYVDHLLQFWLQYNPPLPQLDRAWVYFTAKIPNDNSLLGITAYMQFADNETALPPNQWTNPIGLTTTNGVTLQMSAMQPTLGIATVTSGDGPAGVVPTKGLVDVGSGPILRILYD